MTLQEIEDLLVDETKLTRSKRKWVQEARFIVDGTRERSRARLPPGQHLTESWPVLDLGIQPEIARDAWRLKLAGLLSVPIVFDWATLSALPQHSITRDIHCVTAWSRYDDVWTGVSLKEIAPSLSIAEQVTAVMITASDGYKTNLLLEDLLSEGSMLVHSWNGKPLTREHGGPVRLFVPHLYLWKSAKWISEIEFTAKEARGFWENGGYHRRGDPWLQQRYRGSEEIGDSP